MSDIIIDPAVPEAIRLVADILDAAGQPLPVISPLAVQVKLLRERTIDAAVQPETTFAAAKIKRDAFLYMDGKAPKPKFAQCSTCRSFTGSSCMLFSSDFPVKPDASCGLYVHGDPYPKGKGQETSSVTPEEAGYVERQVRCRNCRFSDGKGKCMLFEALNQKLPDIFDLDTEIYPDSCCNAQMPKG